MHFIRGTVPLHGIVENAGRGYTRGEILDRSVLPDGRHIFDQTLHPGRGPPYNIFTSLCIHAYMHIVSCKPYGLLAASR